MYNYFNELDNGTPGHGSGLGGKEYEDKNLL